MAEKQSKVGTEKNLQQHARTVEAKEEQEWTGMDGRKGFV